MGDVNKTVEITYSANIGPLKRGMSQIPNVTRQEMRAAIKSVDAQLSKAAAAAKRTANKMRANFKNAAKGIGAVGSALAVAGAGVLTFGQQMADLTNDLVDTSTKTGLAVETLSGLRVAAEGSGLAFEQFIGPLQRLQAHMVDASNGVKISTELFDSMGITVTDTNGQLRDADSVFREMMSNLGAMENPLHRNSILMDAFGKSGAMFAQSGVVGALDEFVNLSRTFGAETMPNALDQAANFQRAMADLSLVGQGTMQSILMTITGTGGLTDAIDSITEGIIYFEASFKAAFAAISIPVTVLQTELYSLAVLMTDGLDAAKAAWDAGSDLVQKDVDMFNNAFTDAEAKITALRTARNKIRGTSTEDDDTGQESAKAAAQSAKDQAKAIGKVTEARRTDLEVIKQMTATIENLRDVQLDLRTDQLSDVDLARKAHNERLNQYDEQIDAINRRYGEEYKALLELYDNKEITEEEGMARVKAMETELLEAVDQANFAKAASYRRMQRDIDAIGEEAKQKEIQRQEEIKEAFKTSMIDAGMSIMDSMTTIQESELKRLENQLAESIEVINEREKAGLMTSERAAELREKIEEGHEEAIKKQQMKIYNMKKSTAIAQILIDAATAAARAFADFPFPASLGIATLAGAGAMAQIKAVESTPAPVFDMGGMIGNNDPRRPDERYVRALEGEAILDRATVQSLGGESGIRNLQNGGSAGGVVVVQPFKHFDRFMNTQNRRRRKRSGRGKY